MAAAASSPAPATPLLESSLQGVSVLVQNASLNGSTSLNGSAIQGSGSAGPRGSLSLLKQPASGGTAISTGSVDRLERSLRGESEFLSLKVKILLANQDQERMCIVCNFGEQIVREVLGCSFPFLEKKTKQLFYSIY